MTHPKLIILSTAEAGLLLQSGKAGEIDSGISIVGQREPGLAVTLRRHLHLSFDDANEPDPGTISGLLEKARRDRQQVLNNAPKRNPPTRGDVNAIIKFAAANTHADALLIHCAGGISRSPATGIVCLLTWGLPLEEVIRRVRLLRPAAQPHRGIIRFADELLDLRGQLIKVTS